MEDFAEALENGRQDHWGVKLIVPGSINRNEEIVVFMIIKLEKAAGHNGFGNVKVSVKEGKKSNKYIV